MSDSQIEIPESFIRLYLDPGRIKPRESRAFIAQRYDLCEDMAQMLMDPARDTLWQLSITEWDVLQRMQQGLIGGEVNLSLDESQWVAQRLAELLGWNADGLFD
jgi:hypothetical protein